jgi:hypothetical protein
MLAARVRKLAVGDLTERGAALLKSITEHKQWPPYTREGDSRPNYDDVKGVLEVLLQRALEQLLMELEGQQLLDAMRKAGTSLKFPEVRDVSRPLVRRWGTARPSALRTACGQAGSGGASSLQGALQRPVVRPIALSSRGTLSSQFGPRYLFERSLLCRTFTQMSPKPVPEGHFVRNLR